MALFIAMFLCAFKSGIRCFAWKRMEHHSSLLHAIIFPVCLMFYERLLISNVVL